MNYESKILSKNFKIIRQLDDTIELKSQYHYWRIIKKSQSYFLHHKYEINDDYHKQSNKPFPSIIQINNLILQHDIYFSLKLSI